MNPTTSVSGERTVLEWTRELDRLIDERFGYMVEIRRHMHSHPEPSGHEFETTLYLQRKLVEAGLRARPLPEARGLIVEPPGSVQPRIALRADIDALRIQDAKQAKYCSTVPGVMHACGHDGHAAILAGALLGLKAAEEARLLPWPVAWRGLFQPAEETSKGAHEMIAAGGLDGIEAILALHLDPSRPVGRIGVRVGGFTASCDELEVQIEGRGGHAARPHESLDPIAAAAQLISSIYLFVPRGVDSHNPVVVTIGQIHGGDNPNVIPEQVTLRGTVRTLGGDVRNQTKEHIRQLARGLAEASGTKIQVDFGTGPQAVVNDPELTQIIRGVGSDLLGMEQVEEIPRPSMGGEDFAHYLERVPGSMFRLGCRSSRIGGHPLHSPLFDIDEQAMSVGAKILARAAIMWSDPDRRDKESP